MIGQQENSEAAANGVAAFVGVAATAAVFYAGLLFPSFSVDSWTFFELSRTVFTDFFRYNTIRQYANPDPYSASYPPGWPVLIAVTRAAGLDFGIYTGYLLNAVISLGLLFILMRLAKRVGMPGWGGAIVYLCLLSFKPYLAEEPLAAMSMALSLLLFFGGLTVLAGPTLGVVRAGCVGILISGACATRFDSFPAVLVIAVALLLIPGQTWGVRLARTASFGVAVALVLSPWIAYNMNHFGKPFFSDESRQVLATHPNAVLDYYSEPPATLFTQPEQWFAGLFSKKLTRILRGAWHALISSLLPGLAVVWLVVGWGATSTPTDLPAQPRWFTWLGLCLIPVLMAPVLIVGYGMIRRYYTGPMLLIYFIALPTFLLRLPQPIFGPWRVGALLGVLGIGAVVSLIPETLPAGFHPLNPRASLVSSVPTEEMLALKAAVRDDAAGRAHRLLITDDYQAARFGAVTGEPTALPPRLRGNLSTCLRDWAITHVYDSNDWHKQHEHLGVVFEPLETPKLLRIRFVKPS